MALVPSDAVWNETTPAGTDLRSEGDDRIRELKKQVREVVAQDHKYESSGQGSDWGMHKVLRLIQQAANPDTDASHIQLYSKSIAGKDELFLRDLDGNVVQLTAAGIITAPSDIPYSTGTVTVANGSPTIEGAGGMTWLTKARKGMTFHLVGDSRDYSVLSITDDDTLVLTENWANTYQAAGASKKYTLGAHGSFPIVVRLGVQEDFTNDASLGDTALVFKVGAAETWKFKYKLLVTNHTTPDCQFAINGPAGTTLDIFGIAQKGTNGQSMDWFTAAYNSTLGGAIPLTTGFTGDIIVTLEGTLITSATPGTIALQMAQRTSQANTVSLLVGSQVVAQRIQW